MVDTTNPLSLPMPGPQKFPKDPVPGKEPSTKLPKILTLLDPPTAPTGPSLEEQLAKNNGVAQARRDEVEASSFWDVVGDKFMTETAVGTAARRSYINSLTADDQPDPTFKVTPEMLAGHTTADQDWLASSQNRRTYDMRKWDLQDWKEQQERSNIQGPVAGFFGSVLAGLPEGVVTGAAFARGAAAAGVGAARYAAAGRMGAAGAANLGENVVGNLAAVAAQSTWDTHVGPTDYAFAVGFGGLATLMSIPGLRDVHTETKLAELQDAAIKEADTKLADAEKKVGPDATDTQIKTELDRQEIEDRRNATGDSGDVPEDRKIFDDPSKEDEPPPPKEEAQPPKEEVAPPQEEVLPPAEESAQPPKEEPVKGYVNDGVLPKELSGAKPKWKTREFKFDSDIDKALYITSQVKKSKSDAKYREWLKAQGLTDNDIAAFGKRVRNNMKLIAGSAAEGDELRIGAVYDRNKVATRPEVEEYDSLKFKNDATATGKLDALMNHPLGEIRHLAGRLSKLVEGVKVEILTHDEIKARYAGTENASVDRSHYHPGTHSIVLEPADMNPGREWVMLHEAAHAASYWKLRALASAKDPLWTEFDKLRRDIKATLRKKFGDDYVNPEKTTTGYLLQTNDEFLAGAFSARAGARDFLNALHMITLPGEPKSAFSTFVSKLLKILGMQETEHTALSRLLDLSDHILASETGIRHTTSGGVTLQLSPSDILKDPVARKYGVHLRGMSTPAREAEAGAILGLFKRAIERAPAVDEKRLSKLMDTALFSGGQATANVLARSKNIVARWITGELLESPGGATGRRSTAAITRFMEERRFLGNTLNDVELQYAQFRKEQGQHVVNDFFGGETRQQFDRMVAAEIESRRPGRSAVESPETVKRAADALEAAYERMRLGQQQAKTVGWANLPETSRGYMPHRMHPDKVMNMTMAQKEALHAALTDQFITVSGWDITFSDSLASKYIEGVERRALGGYDAPIGLHQTGAADVIEEALASLGMGKDQIKAEMKKLSKAGARHTKTRIDLDLTRTYTTEGGDTFRLLDLFDTNQFDLLRAQAARVSGEVALAKHGIYGKAHLALIREALATGDVNTRASAREMQAFDQIAAEFLNQPFGTQNKWVDRVMQFNSLARLGGMGFTQAAEAINGLASVGVARTLAGIASFGRLRSEILALARGEKVNNPLLKSLEDFGGAEFGTDSYKIVFPYDNSVTGHNTFGAETTSVMDRLLRGGSHLQGKLSFWRAIHATQQRAFAEATVRKAMEGIRRGDVDVVLKDIGVDEGLAGRIRRELANIAEFDSNGNLSRLDITKMEDTAAAHEFVQAVHRSVNQIIQGTFIGERGAWAHSPMARIMTQFRTFSLTSVEKQWARQYGNRGMMGAFGILMGSMSIAAPLYMARTYAQSIGRKDQEEYLEKRLSSYAIARATLNYVAASGLAGDFLDAGQAIAGRSIEGNARGGAAGSRFIGNLVAPSVGLVDDAWKAVQNTKEGTDMTELLKTLPGSKLPYMLPLINALGE